ncbi:MAG: hypothetical protein JWR00_620 [Rubritepida sp.]|jgi:hypothetical protein|nr:hypothetical protein [Rubritepida sp.]
MPLLYPWDRNTVAEPPLNLEAVIARFPHKGLLIRQLCLSDPSFRSLCEEYGLARMCLVRFESLNDAAHDAEIEEYRSVIAALEVEISRFLARSA